MIIYVHKHTHTHTTRAAAREVVCLTIMDPSPSNLSKKYTRVYTASSFPAPSSTNCASSCTTVVLG